MRFQQFNPTKKITGSKIWINQVQWIEKTWLYRQRIFVINVHIFREEKNISLWMIYCYRGSRKQLHGILLAKHTAGVLRGNAKWCPLIFAARHGTTRSVARLKEHKGSLFSEVLYPLNQGRLPKGPRLRLPAAHGSSGSASGGGVHGKRSQRDMSSSCHTGAP